MGSTNETAHEDIRIGWEEVGDGNGLELQTGEKRAFI